MQVLVYAKILTVLLGIVGLSTFIPIITALVLGESVVISFLAPSLVAIAFALFFLFIGKGKKAQLSTRSGFVIVALSWVFTSIFGALPLVISGAIPNIVDAFFESVSGFSTTGATILGDIESLPRSINLWRCQMHWLGGMGVVTLTVALLPLLGVGGFQLIKAETTGPQKGKVTPKIAQTAKILWFIYLGLTVLQTIALMFCGMDFIDAITHSFATLGTGGFSSRNSSIASYNSATVDIVCTIFMFLAGVNFSLYFYLLIGKFSQIKEDTELKAYILIYVIAVLLIAINLLSVYKNFFTSLRFSSFNVAAILTTTGFATADFTLWPAFSQAIIFFLYFVGGCSGSTGGGIKVIRLVILGKQLNNEIKKMLHPYGVFAIRLNHKAGRKDLVFSVAAFVFLYMLLVGLTLLIGCLGGLDLFSSLTGALSMVGNVGPAFGALGPSCNYGFLPSFVKLFYCFSMLAGRLELWTMIIFFHSDFAKK